MERSFYLDLAASGRRLPVATHLVLHEQPDPEAILLDGERLAQVVVETARRFDTPLALPIMDLTLEEDVLLHTLGVAAEAIPTYRFDELPSEQDVQRVRDMDVLSSPRIKACCDAIAAIAGAHDAGAPELPIGMCIGPFSLLTKLVADPITSIYLAGEGTARDEDPDVDLVCGLLEVCELTVDAYIRVQIAAGAKAIFVCEPAANLVYFSPNQLAAGSSVYTDFVIAPNLRLKQLLEDAGVDLIFHDCGSLTPEMIASFTALDPVILSLGSPVQLWDAAPLLPKDVVLFGNLPTKKFYSDAEVPLDAVPGLVREIDEKLTALGHPHIVGSECDILAMPGYEGRIMEKVLAVVSVPALQR